MKFIPQMLHVLALFEAEPLDGITFWNTVAH